RLLRRPDRRRARGLVVLPAPPPPRLVDGRRARSRRGARPGDRPARLLRRRLLLGQAHEPALGRDLHGRLRVARGRHADGHAAAPEPALRIGRGLPDLRVPAVAAAAQELPRAGDARVRRALLRGPLRARVPARRPRARLLVRRRAVDVPGHRHRPAAGHGRPAAAAPPHAAPRDRRRLTAARLAEAHELVVGADEAGQRLDAWLARRLPELSRSRLQALIAAGEVEVDSAPARASARVRAGQRAVVRVPPAAAAEPKAEDIPLRIVHEDAALLVIDKPAGLVVHPGAGTATGTLVNALLGRVRDLSGVGGVLRPGIVHRLDRGTSGLLVVAKDDRTHRALA